MEGAPKRNTLPAEFWEQKHIDGWGEGRAPEKRLLEFVEKYRDQMGTKLIDLGSGKGRHIIPLAEAGFDVTGVELTRGGIEESRKQLEEANLEAELVQGDYHDLKFDAESFDSAISVQSFQFNDWEGAEKSFSEVSRVLKPGGLFFLRVRSLNRAIPDSAEFIDDTGVTFSVKTDQGEAIYHNFSLEEIQELAEKNNMEIIEEPFEEGRILEDGSIKPQTDKWNVVMRKKVT